MSYLRAPSLGPIVGHTTATSCRIWVRGEDPRDIAADLASEKRTVGVIGLMNAANEVDPDSIYYFRLHREFDRTGTFVVGDQECLDTQRTSTPLEPNSEYSVRVGTLSLDDPRDDNEIISDEDISARLPAAREWADDLGQLPEEKSQATFRTFPSTQEDSSVSSNMSFIAGSCRYPGFLFGAKRADEIFDAVHSESKVERNGTAANFVLMTGDQIYADTLNRHLPIGRADTFEEFQERYHNALGSPHMRRLLRNTTTYMILDDHEIEDNWSQDRLSSGSGGLFGTSKRDLFTLAITAYMSYQWSHGPRSFGRRLFYTFECGGYPFFVCDTRTQRYLDSDQATLDDNHLLGRPALNESSPSQIDRLLAWLISQPKNLPKFIVTSSVFAPNPIFARDSSSNKRKISSDSWPAFPTTRRAILDCIVENEIQNTIFISGDIHCANLAEMSFENAESDIKAYSITSSAFHWPFNFADGDPANFVHDSRAEKQFDPFVLSDGQTTMHYRAWNFTQDDNFCRVNVDRENAQIIVRTFNKDGEIVRDEQDGRQHEEQLALTPW